MAIRIVGVDLPQNKRGEIASTNTIDIGQCNQTESFSENSL